MAIILLIDDDKEVLEINKRYLEREGLEVHAFANPVKGLQYVRSKPVDCVILDVMMPGMDGYELCKKLRTFSSVPVIFLTGKGSEDDRINGLITGADDYIVKPYSLRELKVRIDVILRRSTSEPPSDSENILTFGSLTINKLSHKAIYNGDDLGLANREYEVLLFLASHPNEEITFEQLGTALFGSYMESDRRSVMVNVSRLRKKMALDFELENMIETIWSKGYKFVTR